MSPTAKFGDVPRRLEGGPKREDDGREGAISGRLARKATGVSSSGFARSSVFAEMEVEGQASKPLNFQASTRPWWDPDNKKDRGGALVSSLFFMVEVRRVELLTF